MTSGIGLDMKSRLMALEESWVSGVPPESPRTAFERSIARLDLASLATAGAVEQLLEWWPVMLPTLATCRAHILAPAFAGMAIVPTAISAGLTASAPASGHAVLALGWVERRWRADGVLAAKIRVSACRDATGQVFWDFGVAGRNPPRVSSMRDGVRAAAALAPAYGARLDLTPSHEKAAWLALRLGGRPSEPHRYRKALRLGRWQDIRGERLAFDLGAGQAPAAT